MRPSRARRVPIVVVALLALCAAAGCHNHDPHAAIADFVTAVDRRDADAALERMVSPAQLSTLLDCPAGAIDGAWLLPSARAARLDHAREKWMAAREMRVTLGPLFEEYDRPAQWKTYEPGDVLSGCRVKAPFAVEVYRVVLVFDGGVMRHVESTKPVDIWRIENRPYLWDDPFDTEVWE